MDGLDGEGEFQAYPLPGTENETGLPAPRREPCYYGITQELVSAYRGIPMAGIVNTGSIRFIMGSSPVSFLGQEQVVSYTRERANDFSCAGSGKVHYPEDSKKPSQ
ncbi:MAG: hypothetical protein ACOCWZ_03790 [Spirochaetota bacterium]